jgi:hypothetical protein
LLLTFSLALSSLVLSACGGSNDATVGGTLTGLGTGVTLVLQNNASDSLTLTANGNFTFAKTLLSSAAYAVTVLTQPVGQVCSVTNASGTIDTMNDSVSNVAVACTTNATVTGTVAGLPAGTAVTLSNAGIPLVVAANGQFAFTGVLAVGATYAVTVTVQPLNHTCLVTNGAGTVVAGTLVNVLVNCT